MICRTRATLFFTDDTTSPTAIHRPVAGPAAEGWLWVVRTGDTVAKTEEFNPWSGTTSIQDKIARNITRNTTTGEFVVEYDGVYAVRADFVLRSGASAGTRHQVVLKIKKNGTAQLTREVDVNPDWGEQSHTAEAILALLADDTVEVTVTPQSSYSVSAEDDTTFSMYRIGGNG